MRARTILMHLNVSVPADDNRSIGEIAEAIEGAIEVGSDDPSLAGLVIQTALVDEV
jgi:hypothetical protein